MSTAGKKDPRAEPDDEETVSPERSAVRPPEGDDDERPIDIAAAVRAAKTAVALGRMPPAPQETAKMGAFDLEQALAKLHRDVAHEKDEPPPPSHLPTVRPKAQNIPTPHVPMNAAEIQAALEADAAEPKLEPPVEPKPTVPAPKADEQERKEEPEEPKLEKPIPIAEPSEPGPMVASIPEPRFDRDAPRGLPRTTILLILLGVALLAGLYAWSQTLR